MNGEVQEAIGTIATGKWAVIVQGRSCSVVRHEVVLSVTSDALKRISWTVAKYEAVGTLVSGEFLKAIRNQQKQGQ